MADREPTRADILAFMDDDERANWDAGKGTPEERAAVLESLTALWRSIPDPTEEQLKPPFSHPDEWPPESSSANRDAVIDFNRQRWKKFRKVEAREELEKRKAGEHPPATTAEPLEAPFDLSRFDPSSLDLSFLHPFEQDRIRRGEYTIQERNLLGGGQNPWTESGKPKPLPPTSSGFRVPAQTADNSPTPEEQQHNELLKFMPKQLRAEYDKADTKRKAALWNANEQNFEAAKEREERRLRQYQEKTEKTLDLLHRIQEDPNKADLLPPDDASMDDLHKWHDKMSKPNRLVPFPGEGGRADANKAALGARPDPQSIYGPGRAPEDNVIPATRETPSFTSAPVPKEETIGYQLERGLKHNVAEAERLLSEQKKKPKKKLPERTASQKIRLLVEALFGIGVGLSGTQIKSMVLSVFLILVGWGLVTAVIWELNFLENKRQWQQRILNSLLTLLAGTVLFGIWWGARPEPGLTRKDVEEVIRNETALPNVETAMTIDKRLRIENRGGVSLIEVELTFVDYLFQKRAWDEKRLQIEMVNRINAPFARFERIDSGKASEEIDLNKVPALTFRHFMDVTDHDEAARRNYLIRITFRDQRTKEKYITYRVTTSVRNAPGIFENLSTTSRSGPGRRILEDDIPAAIINAQRQIDAGFGAKEISIKYQWQN